MRRLPLLLVLLGILATGCTHRTSEGWEKQVLIRAQLPPERNALTYWRPHFAQLFPEDPAVVETLNRLSSPLESPAPADTTALNPWLALLAPAWSDLSLREGDSLQLPPITGPETPFPDHQPLRQLALVRLGLLKITWSEGRSADAVTLAIENLRLARAFLNAQEGLIPLIQATGVWQLALDGVYWIARQETLSREDAGRLQSELSADETLASQALIRALRGEFTFFTRLVLARLPETQDVNLLLSSISSLGIAEPEAPRPGELRLATPTKNPLDRDATLQLAASDITDWTHVLATQRHPRGFYALHTQKRLQAHAAEIGAFLSYAIEDIPPTTERIKAADTILARVKNPVGKLFLVITTSQWEAFSAHVYRREAQRSALTGLLAWRQLGQPADWHALIAGRVLSAAPADPFSSGSLQLDLDPLHPRIWSVGLNGLDDGGAGSGENTGYPLDLAWPAK